MHLIFKYVFVCFYTHSLFLMLKLKSVHMRMSSSTKTVHVSNGLVAGCSFKHQVVAHLLKQTICCIIKINRGIYSLCVR